MSDARTDPLPHAERTEETARLGKYEVQYSRDIANRANLAHDKSPFLAKWQGNLPPGAPDRIVCKEFRLPENGPEEQQKVKTNQDREKRAYEIIRTIPPNGGGRWLMRCYGWDTTDPAVWKAVFEQAGPNSMAYSQQLDRSELVSFVEVVLLCALDAVTELARHGVYTRDIHPGNIMLPLGYTEPGQPSVPDHVILGDFDHAYMIDDPVTEGFGTGMAVTTSQESLLDSVNQTTDPRNGEIDELFRIAATCHILLTQGKTVWRKNEEAIEYKRQNLRAEDLLKQEYVLFPDQEALRDAGADLHRVLNVMLHDKRTERERAIQGQDYKAALENIKARNRNRLQGRANLSRIEEPTQYVGSSPWSDDYSQWYIPLNPARRRAQSRRNIVWGDGLWGRLSRFARVARGWSFLPALLIPLAVTGVLTFWPGIGLLSSVPHGLPDWPGGAWTPVQIIVALAITGASLLLARPATRWLWGAGIGIIGGVGAFTVLLVPGLLIAGLEQFFYGQMTYSWEHQDWLPWQWGFVADAGVILALLVMLARLRARPRALKSLLVLLVASTLIAVGGGIAAPIVNANTTTLLGGPASCVNPLNFVIVSRRFCVQDTGTWTVVTASASSDSMWKALTWGAAFKSSGNDPVNELQVALLDPDIPCLTEYVSVTTATPQLRLPDHVSAPLLDGKDQVLKTVNLVRTTADGKEQRVVAGANHFAHYTGESVLEGSKVSSVDVYSPYALSNGSSGRGFYGSTDVGVYAVQRGCNAADAIKIANQTNELLSSMRMGDDGGLDNTYFRSDPDALSRAGMKLDYLFVPVDGSIRPTSRDYSPPPLGVRNQIATTEIKLSGTVAILALVPSGDNVNWGVPDANHPGWTSVPSSTKNNKEPAIPDTVFSKLFDTETGKIRVTVDFPTDPAPTDSAKSALSSLLSRIEVRIPASATSATPTNSK